jgi:hypothetical protein
MRSSSLRLCQFPTLTFQSLGPGSRHANRSVVDGRL